MSTKTAVFYCVLLRHAAEEQGSRSSLERELTGGSLLATPPEGCLTSTHAGFALASAARRWLGRRASQLRPPVSGYTGLPPPRCMHPGVWTSPKSTGTRLSSNSNELDLLDEARLSSAASCGFVAQVRGRGLTWCGGGDHDTTGAL